MRGLVAGLAALWMLALPVMAQEDPVQQVILQQLEAFRADDVDGAFAFASPSIKSIFMTAENFGTMVRDGYPMVDNPGEVRMLEQREIAGNLWQKVLITDPAGNSHVLDYQMVKTAEGWQINGVRVLPEPGVGA